MSKYLSCLFNTFVLFLLFTQYILAQKNDSLELYTDTIVNSKETDSVNLPRIYVGEETQIYLKTTNPIQIV